MKNKYVFTVSSSGKLVCIKYRKGQIKTFVGDKAINILANKDKRMFNSVKLNEKHMVLKSDKAILDIRDLNAFAEYGYLYYLKNNFDFIRREVIKLQKEEHKNKEFKRQFGSIIITTSALALAILLGTIGFAYFKDKNHLPEPKNDFNEETIDDDYIVDGELIDTEDLFNTTGGLTITIEDELENTDLLTELEYETININLVNSPDLEKMENVKYYDEIIENYSEKWGISSNIVRAILTQESGGYQKNLMQIEFDQWVDTPMTAYNFRDDIYQTIVLTNDPSKYTGKNYTVITKEDILNPITNISVGICMLRTSIAYMDNNIPAGIQCYNFGKGAMDDVIEKYAMEHGMTRDEVLADTTNIDYLNYTDVKPDSYGDHNYVSNVTMYLDDDSIIELKVHNKEQNEDTVIRVNIQTTQKNIII